MDSMTPDNSTERFWIKKKPLRFKESTKLSIKKPNAKAVLASFVILYDLSEAYKLFMSEYKWRNWKKYAKTEIIMYVLMVLIILLGLAIFAP